MKRLLKQRQLERSQAGVELMVVSPADIRILRVNVMTTLVEVSALA